MSIPRRLRAVGLASALVLAAGASAGAGIPVARADGAAANVTVNARAGRTSCPPCSG
jgi:hypothetical protein